MAEAINPISSIRLTQISGEDNLAQIEGADPVSKGVFSDILDSAINALNSVSDVEFNANNLISDYIAGKAELSDVMVASAKMSIAVQLAVTAITSTVNTFKEITQIAI